MKPKRPKQKTKKKQKTTKQGMLRVEPVQQKVKNPTKHGEKLQHIKKTTK